MFFFQLGALLNFIVAGGFETYLSKWKLITNKGMKLIQIVKQNLVE